MKTRTRIILSILSLIVYHWIATWAAYQSTLTGGYIGAQQLSNTDMSADLATMHMLGYVPFGMLILCLLSLLWIWWKPLKQYFMGIKEDGGNIPKALAVIGLTGLIAFQSTNAYAYYSTSDYAEWVQIAPNETAFFIPVEGANQTTQAKFESAEFLDKKKVAAKRVNIPHMKQPGSGTIRDYYVPSAILIVVDRKMVSRTFRGEDPNDPCGRGAKCFQVQTNEGIRMWVGVAVTATILEENAAKYLYRHGVIRYKVGDTNPENGEKFVSETITYAAEYEALPLDQVMDTNIHNEIQALLSQEFGKLSLHDALSQQAKIMDTVRTEITTRFVDVGITIQSIGYATPIVLPADIQASINAVISSKGTAEALGALRPVMDVRERQASIDVKEAWATAIRTDKLPKVQLPSFLVLSDGITKWFNTLFASWGNDDGKK